MGREYYVATRRALGIAAVLTFASSAALVLAQDRGAQKAGAYKDAARGFSMNPPAFKPGPDLGVGVIAIFMAPPEDGFAANVNLLIQKAGFDDFIKSSDAGFQAAGFDVQTKKLGKTGTHRSCEFVYKGAIQGKAMKFMALAVENDDRVFLLTATSLEAHYDKYEPVFKDSLASFSLDK